MLTEQEYTISILTSQCILSKHEKQTTLTSAEKWEKWEHRSHFSNENTNRNRSPVVH